MSAQCVALLKTSPVQVTSTQVTNSSPASRSTFRYVHHPRAPLKKQRLIALSPSLVWSIIGACIGLNALIKSDQEQIDIQEKVPSGVTVHVENLDLYVPGAIITACCATIALLAAMSILVTVVWLEYATHWLKTQGAIFNFFNGVTTFRDGVKLPPEAVQALITATGVSDKYSKQHSAVLLAIFPWISVLFTSIFVALLYIAARRCDRLRATSRMSTPEKRLTDEI